MWYGDLPERNLVPPEYGEESWPRCPVCGATTDTFYRNEQGDIVGCEECIHYVDAWQWWENYREAFDRITGGKEI